VAQHGPGEAETDTGSGAAAPGRGPFRAEPDTRPAWSEPDRVSSSQVRAFLYGLAGWGIPLLVALPLAGTHEAAGGEAAIYMGVVWLFALGPVGSLVGGALVAGVGRRVDHLSGAFGVGLGAMALAIVPLFVIDSMVTVLTLGSATFLLPIPMVVAYVLGFGARMLSGGFVDRPD
jgi:hypothetical protein